MATTYLLLGGNLGDRLANLEQAQKELLGFGEVLLASNIYETAAWGVEDQPDFLNQAIKLETNFSPHNLLDGLQAIEKRLGRERIAKWYARTMDIDLLIYEEDVIDTVRLQVPHPLMLRRRFVLMPFAEIAPNLNHPVLNKPIEALLSACEDPLEVKLYKRVL